MGKNNFKYFSQEFNSNVLDLIKQKWFDPYEYMSNFEKFIEELPSKENFYSLLTGKNIKYVCKIWNIF